jgi:hypothetical protein
MSHPWPMNSAPGPSAPVPRCTENSSEGLRSSSGSTDTPGINLQQQQQQQQQQQSVSPGQSHQIG